MRNVISTTYNKSDIRNLLADILNPIVADEIQKIISSLNKPKPAADEYITRKQACAILKVSMPTLVKLSTNGMLKQKIVGGNYRYSKTQIETYMNTR